MKKHKTALLYLMLIIFVQLAPRVSADSNITVNSISGEVIISGKSQRANQDITIAVLTPGADIENLAPDWSLGEIIHAASIKSDSKGDFKHRFKLSGSIESGEYIVHINDGVEIERLSFVYNPQPYPYMDFPIGNNEVSAQVSSFAKKVVISGDADSGLVATVLVYNPSGDLHFAGSQTVSGRKFSFEYEMSYSDQSGDYRVFVSVPKAKSKVELSYSFANSIKIKEVIDAINSFSSSEQILSILNSAENKSAFISLGCFADDYYKLSEDAKKAFAKAIFRDGADYSPANDYAEFTEHFNQSLLMAVVNSEKDADKLLEFLKDKADLIGIDFSQNSPFVKTSKQLQAKIMMDFINEGDYIDFEDLKTSFYLKSFLNLLNETSYTAFDSLLEYYVQVFDINIAGYEGLDRSKKSEAAREVTKNTYSTLSEFQEGLNIAVRKVKSGSSPSGPGGGTGGGGPAYAPVLVPDVGQVPVSENETREVFNDINAVPWAKEGILALYKQGILSGDGNGNFNPQANIRREEFVKIIVLAFDIPQKDGEIAFSDVSEEDWYYQYIKTATLHGIVQGDGAAFGVGEYITRQDIAAVLYRILKEEAKPDISKFADDDEISDYAREAVYYLKQKGHISGTPENYFLPKAFATRAEVSKILHGMLN